MATKSRRGGVGIETLVGALYGAAIGGPDEVSGCLRRTADAVGGVAPALSAGGPGGADLLSLDVSEDRLAEWHDEFDEPLRASLRRHHLEGTFLASQIGAPIWADFLHDWAHPQGFEDLAQGLRLTPERVYGLGIFRERGSGRFEPTDLELIEGLMPHVVRALQLRERMSSVVGARDAATAALERLSIGFVLLDARGRVIEASPAAEAILARSDGLTVRDGELRAEAPRERKALARLLGALVERATHPGGSLRVPRLARAPASYSLLAMRLPAARLEVGGRSAVAVVFVSDPEEELVLCEDRVAELHGLTHAEARIACRLAAGKTPREIAEELEISIQTVRNHLKSVYAKTETRGQAELVARLVLGISRLAPEDADLPS